MVQSSVLVLSYLLNHSLLYGLIARRTNVIGDLIDVCGQAYESAANTPVTLTVAFTTTQY